MVKNTPANAGDSGGMGSNPGLRRYSGVGNGNPLLYFCLEDSMNRVTWWATVLRVTESDTTEWLGTRTHMYIHICVLIYF